MSKKLLFCLSICAVFLIITGCAKHATLSTQSTDISTASAQPTDKAAVSSALFQAADDVTVVSSTATQPTAVQSTSYSSATDQGGSNAMNKIIVYEIIKQDVYYQFIRSPSDDILNQQGNGNLESSISITSAGSIKRETVSPNPGIIQEYDEGILRIGSASGLPVYKSLINFAGNTTEIKKYLAQNGVTANIKSVAIISGVQNKSTIWIKANQEDYFITINEQPEDYINNPHSDTYVYRLYNHSSYLEKSESKN